MQTAADFFVEPFRQVDKTLDRWVGDDASGYIQGALGFATGWFGPAWMAYAAGAAASVSIAVSKGQHGGEFAAGLTIASALSGGLELYKASVKAKLLVEGAAGIAVSAASALAGAKIARALGRSGPWGAVVGAVLGAATSMLQPTLRKVVINAADAVTPSGYYGSGLPEPVNLFNPNTW